MRIAAAIILFSICSGLPGQALLWPVADAMPASLDRIEDFLQPTSSGEPESALFGCVRTDGRQFHEGLDIAPVKPRKRGEATDPIVAVYDGVIRHINAIAGNSSYGRYVVIEHTLLDLQIYSLYAHLAQIEDGLKVGQGVPAGSVIGIMGRSAGTYTIPRQRAHLHLEIGLRLTDHFQTWYRRQGFDTPNHHRMFNGMNLVSWDSLDFYRAFREGRADSPLHYISQLPPAVMLHIHTGRRPDFIERYPELVIDGCAESEQMGWEILLTAWGLPISFKPISAGELQGAKNMGDVSVLAVNRPLLEEFACRSIISERSGRVSLARNGEMIIELLFMPNPDAD